MLTRYLRFKRRESRNAFGHNEEKSESRTRHFRRRGLDAANAIGSIVVFRVGRSMIVRLAVVMMVGLNVRVDQAGVLKKRVRTRRQPQCDHGENNKGPQPVHLPNLSAPFAQFNSNVRSFCIH